MALKTVVWAVDAFDSNLKLQKVMVQVIRALGYQEPLAIKPVYVLNAGQLNLSEESTGPWIHYYLPAAKKALGNLIEDLNLKGVSNPHVIMQRSSSTSEATDVLSRYAVSSKADLILVGTHGRSGFRRMMLGSFAETLLLRSKVPVLVINPEIKRVSTLKTFIFPTEFGPHSQVVFRNVVRFAKDFGAKVILFHSIPHPVEPILQSGVYLFGGGAWIPLQSYFGKELERQTRHAEAWTRWAKSQGVQVEFMIDSVGSSVADQIEDLAKKNKASCIFMEAQSGAVAATLIGSVTRQVMRHSNCPVWVVRGNMFAASKKSASVTYVKKAA